MRKQILLCALAIAVLANIRQVYGQTNAVESVDNAKEQNAPLPNDPAVKVGKLANGLTYYIRRNTEPANRAVLYLAVHVGSLMEDDSQQGLAHFTEHMAFNGTADFPKNALIDYLEKAGVRFGADLNAHTAFNETIYKLPIPTDSADLFKTGFKILANWAGKVTMDGEDIDSERGVIVEEDRQRGKNAASRMSDQLLPVMLKGSRYEIRRPIGKIDIVQHFTYDKIRSFYKDWYRPGLQAVIAVGDFDVEQVEQLIKANFSDLKDPDNPRPRVDYTVPGNKEPLVKIVTDPEQAYNVATVIYKHPGGPVKTEGDYKKSFIYSMINAMLANRMQEIVSKGNAPFLIAKSSFGPYQGGLVTGMNAFQITLASSSAKTLLPAFAGALKEHERVARFGFLPSEMEPVKKAMSAANEQRHREMNKTASAAYVEQYVQHFLTGAAMPSLQFSYEHNKQLLASITLQEINAVASTLMTKDNQIVIVQAPEAQKADLPDESALLAAVSTESAGLEPYADNAAADVPLLDKEPVAGKIVSEKKLDAIGVTELTLSNGVKVLLKPTNFANNQIIFSSFSKGGISTASDVDLPSAKKVGWIASSGTEKLDANQLGRMLAGTTARAGAYVDNLYQGYSGSTAPDDIKTAFELIYAAATQPRKDANVFNKTINDYKVVVASRGADPANVFADTVNAVLGSYNSRAMPETLQDVDRISLDKSFAFYKDRMGDNSGQTFVFVGAIDTAGIKPLIETYLASLPATGKPRNFVDHGIRPPKGKVLKTVYKGMEDKAQVRLYLHGDYDYKQESNDQLSALRAALEIRIMQRLREKEGGVYSPQIGLTLDKYPASHYYITISFSCATANVDKLINAALEEVNTLRKNGISSEDLGKFKSEQQRQAEVQLRNNRSWLNIITARLKNNETLNEPVDYQKRMSKITVESSKKVADKYLSDKNYIQLILLPQDQNK